MNVFVATHAFGRSNTNLSLRSIVAALKGLTSTLFMPASRAMATCFSCTRAETRNAGTVMFLVFVSRLRAFIKPAISPAVSSQKSALQRRARRAPIATLQLAASVMSRTPRERNISLNRFLL